jgi:hypothetical protein
LHLRVDVLDQGLTTGQDPPIKDVLTLGRVVIVNELVAGLLLVQVNLAEVEVERVDPLEDDVCEDVSNTFLSETQVFTSDNGRVDKEESDTIGTVLVHNLHWIRVVLELFAHLLAITVTSESVQIP